MSYPPRRRAQSAFLPAVLALLGAACADTVTEPTRPAASALIALEPVYSGPTFYFPASPHVTAGSSHSCALRRDWVAFCWGHGSYGQLGQGRYESSGTPVQVADILFRQIDAGANHTCGLSLEGSAYCWGSNGWLQLGVPSGAQVDASRPVRVATSVTFKQISAGGDHNCALTGGGEVYCWGTNYYGQTGDANLGGYSYTPARVTTNVVFKSVSAGSTYSCGVSTDNHAYCWGYGAYTGAGDGMSSSSPVPVKIGPVTSLSTGTWHACAVTDYYGGDAMCWGRPLAYESDYGMFARGVNTSANFPVPSLAQGGLKWHRVQAGAGKLTCALRRADGDPANDRAVWCWGLGSSGEMGSGAAVESNPLPVRTQLSAGIRSFDVGFRHACAIDAGGTILCWGSNAQGQLGTGGIGGSSTTPVAIVAGGSFAP